MIDGIGSYTIELNNPNDTATHIFVRAPDKTNIFPPGTKVWAQTTLSRVQTDLAGEQPDSPKFSAWATIVSFTFHLADGSESEPQQVWSNTLFIEDCASILFSLSGNRVYAEALANVLFVS